MLKLHSQAPRLPTSRSLRRLARARRGAIIVYAAIMMIVLLAAAAFAIDVGMISMARGELQRTADASALAATSELLYQMKQQPDDPSQVVASRGYVIRQVANSSARENQVFRESPDVELNSGNDQSGEIVIGEMVRGGGGVSLAFSDAARFNSVVVRVRRTAARNGELPLFFGRVLGVNKFSTEAEAQAAFLQEFKGFRVPSGGSDPPTLMMFPFAMDLKAWDAALNGEGSDDYRWDPDSESVDQGHSDGIREIKLYPLDTGAAGNFGTIDIGSDSSSNPTLERQIVDGLSREDLNYHGGQLALDNNGTLILSGDPGMKVGPITDAITKIIGQTRIVPLYSSVSGTGQNAQYTITAFAACRVLAVDLHGGNKQLTVQPAAMITRGGIPGGSSDTSSHIYSPVVLVK